MIKKYSSYILVTICVFFISLMTSYAKEVTLEELTAMVKDINSSASHVYVIGEYAFTSKHTLTTQDIMLAARSIKVNDSTGKINTDEIYNEMIITYLKGNIGSDWELESLEFIKNIGESQVAPKVYDIKYIDYNKIYSKVDVDSLVDTAYQTIKGQASKDKFMISKSENEISVVLKDLEMSSIDALMGTGVATAAANFLKEEGVAAVTLSLGNEQVTIGEELDKVAIEDFFKSLGNKSGDLVGKIMTATVIFEEGYKTANSEEFTISFGKLIDVDALVKKAYKTIEGQSATDKFIVSLDGTTIDVTIMDLEMNSASSLMGTGTATAISNFLKEEGIDSVKLTIDGKSITVGNTVDSAELETFLKNFGNKAGDLIGKTVTAEITFKDGFATLNSDKFNIEFKDANRVDVDSLVKTAYQTILDEAATELFKISKDDNKINVLLKDLEMNSINAIAGSGVATAAANFLKEEGIAAVTLSLGNEQVTIGKELDKAAIEDFFKSLGNKSGDLVGKIMTATVIFEEGYKTANSTEFTINFGKYVDVDALVKKAYKTIEGQSATDKFIVSLDGTTIDVTIMDLEMNSASSLMGTGASTAIVNFLKEEGIESVKITLEGSSFTVGKTVDADALEAFLKNFGNKAGDLVGKTMTAEITFKDGFATLNSDAFDITFTDAIKVDVDSLVKTAYKTIEGQSATDKFLVDFDENIRVIITDLDMSSIDALMGTGVATAAKQFLQEEGIAGVVLEIDGEELTIGNTIDEDEVESFLKKLGNKASDLVGKTMNITVLFEEGYKTINSTGFAVEIAKVEEINIENLVEKAYKVVEGQAAKDKFIAKLNGTEIELMLVDLEMSSVEALTGTGVATAALNFLKETGIKEVTLTLNGNSITIGEELDESEIETFFKSLGTKAGDLVGETMTAKVTLNKGYEAANKDEFTIKLIEEEKVKVEDLVKESYEIVEKQVSKEKFVVSLDGTNIEVIMMDLEMNSISALKGAGVSTAAEKFLAQEGVAGVILELEGNKLTLGNVADKAEIEAFLKSVGNKAADLVNKTINVTVLFEEGYKKANADNFNITLKDSNKVDVANLVTSAYNHITSTENDVFEVSIVDEAELEVSLKDLEATSVEVLLGSGVGEAAFNILKEEGVNSVCLVYLDNKVCFNEQNLNADNVQVFFNNLGTKAGDLVNESIGIEIVFDDGYKSSNIEGLNVTFLKYKYNVNFDIDGSINTEKVAVGEKVSVPTEPTKEGYTFNGWLLNGSKYDFNTPITEEITLKADWKINTYKINVVVNDSTMGSVSIDELTVDYNTIIDVLNNSVTIGNKTVVASPADKTAQYTYSFIGWSGSATSVKNDMTITANFDKTVNSYTVTYVDEIGNILGTEVVEYGTKVSELTAPTKEGKVVVNYIYNSGAIDKETMITNDIKFEVEYATEFNVDESLANSLEEIEADYYTAELVEDEITANFTDSNLKFTDLSFAFEILDLLETLTANDKYKSVILSYDNNPNHQLEIKGNVDITSVARFVGLVTSGQWSGSKGMEADVNKLVTATANKPIDVNVTLVDGYADPTGSSKIDYNLIFTCE